MGASMKDLMVLAFVLLAVAFDVEGKPTGAQKRLIREERVDALMQPAVRATEVMMGHHENLLAATRAATVSSDGRVEVLPAALEEKEEEAQQGVEDHLAPLDIWDELQAPVTWQQASDHAAGKGGRLLTLAEGQLLLRTGGAVFPGRDVWVAVTTADGGKDWMQAGSGRHEPGTSHVQVAGYPSWGDSAGDYKPMVVLYRRLTTRARMPAAMTWQQQKELAASQGARLLSLAEARTLVRTGPLFPGEDAWAAVTDGDGGKDFVQLGSRHPPGTSHVKDMGAYPGWGDTLVGYEPRFVLYTMIGQNVVAEVRPAALTWAQQQSYAVSQRGRLLSLEEMLFRLRSGPLFPGKDAWVAVVTASGGKDWVQAGNGKHESGTSHVKAFGYPRWGDTADGYAPVYAVFTRDPALFAAAAVSLAAEFEFKKNKSVH